MDEPAVFLIVCRTCDRGRDALPIPFASPAERGRWAAEHTRGTSHDQWWVHDGYIPPAAVPAVVARFDMPDALTAAQAENDKLRDSVRRLSEAGKTLADEVSRNDWARFAGEVADMRIALIGTEKLISR